MVIGGSGALTNLHTTETIAITHSTQAFGISVWDKDQGHAGGNNKIYTRINLLETNPILIYHQMMYTAGIRSLSLLHLKQIIS